MMVSNKETEMAVQHLIKSNLAKLLATEALVVEHRNVPTACFNTKSRILTLPMWEKASSTVYDLLVGHEVGHALFTPNEDWISNKKIPKQFVNVTEDARVEKLMKRRYAGLAKTFYAGYKELNEDNFFQIENDDISTFNLADRANLYFKIGNFIPLSFTAEEMDIIELIDRAETFSDALNAAEVLYKYCKKNTKESSNNTFTGVNPNDVGDYVSEEDFSRQEEQDETEDEEETQNSDVDTSGIQEDVEENDFSDDSSEENNLKGDEPTNGPNSEDEEEDVDDESDGEEEPEIKTVDSLADKIRDLASFNGIENVYIEVPKVNLNTVIGKNSEIHEEIDHCFTKQQEIFDQERSQLKLDKANLFIVPDKSYKEFKVSSQREVNYLVKEFECRKSADSYSRASVARTGVLDTSKLHSYKFTEDIFKKVMVLPDGKNHGLIFVLDWSGSMSSVLLDTCKQLFNLIWFCKKVSIPFEVYAFTNEWRRFNTMQQPIVPVDRTPHHDKTPGVLHVSESFSLMNILTSKVSTSVLEHQLKNIWRIAHSFSNYYSSNYSCPNRLRLSGTPLNESFICLHEIIPQFQSENKLQKVHCIVLTDGESASIPYQVELEKYSTKETYIGTRHISPDNCLLRDRKIGTTYRFDCGYNGLTDTLLRNLKDKFPSVSFIGIRLLMGRDANRFIELYHTKFDKQYKTIQNDWTKNKSFTITNSGYHAYFGIRSSVLSQDSEFKVEENATKSQIKSAFVKSFKVKKTNKKILEEFITLIT